MTRPPWHTHWSVASVTSLAHTLLCPGGFTVLISCGTDRETQYALVVRAWSLGTSVPHSSPSSATYCASVSSSGKRIIIITLQRKEDLEN